MQVIYEDNHIIAINKACGEIVQGDKTGDVTLIDKVKEYIKIKYKKTRGGLPGLASPAGPPDERHTGFCAYQ